MIKMQWQDFVKDENPMIRASLASHGYGLKDLAHDEDSTVRAEVASLYPNSHLFMEDPDPYVRSTCVSKMQNAHVYKFTYDEAPEVRAEVAKRGLSLHKLINDNHPHVRAAVASKMYGLNQLMHDDEFYVRAKVAETGFQSDVMSKDINWFVRLQSMCKNVDDGIFQNLLDDPMHLVREKAASCEGGWEKAMHHENEWVRASSARWSLQNHPENVEIKKKWMKDPSELVKAALLLYGNLTDDEWDKTMLENPSEALREAAALMNKPELYFDEEPSEKIKIILLKKNPKMFLHQWKKLNIPMKMAVVESLPMDEVTTWFWDNALSKDDSWMVRSEVAKRGYKPQCMILDNDQEVRFHAFEHLMKYWTHNH